jgi:hypothetical protein
MREFTLLVAQAFLPVSLQARIRTHRLEVLSHRSQKKFGTLFYSRPLSVHNENYLSLNISVFNPFVGILCLGQ